MHEQIDTLHDALSSDSGDLPSIPENGTTPAPDFLFQLLNHPHLCAEIRAIWQEEARHIYALWMDKFFLETAKDALSEDF